MRRRAEPEWMDDLDEAEAYARADFRDVNEAFVDRLLELAGSRETADAVDLGTGPGDIPLRVWRRRPGWRIVAVDASEAMLSFARKAAEEAGAGQAIRWVLADAKRTALPDAAFEVVFSNSILHHITQTDVFWAEVRRLARPAALLFLRDLARPDDEAAARRIVQRYAAGESELLREEFYRSLLSSYTVAEVRQQLRRAGLGGLEVRMVTDRHLDIFGRVE